jgi:EAL and modified HD-GYP domain-containing signal transduction protein
MHFLGRQPILDAELNLYGHELLYRSGIANEFSGEPEHATRSVIDDSLLLASPTNGEKLFFNCTRHALVSGIVTLLPPADTVLEILEDIEPDDELMAACRTLKGSGYSFALDDFVPDGSKTPFLEIADFIKIDFLASDKAERYAIRSLAAGKPIKFIAEKIETEPDVEEAWKEGCTFFQGYFFCKPVMIAPRVIPQNQMVYMRLLAELSREPANVLEIEQLTKSEPSICYRLLRLVNSALYALPSPISSIRSAVMLIGDDEFRKLVSVALANIAGSSRSKSVTRVALARAKFCELLAPVLNESGSTLYLLGMLSLMDVILTMPMHQVVEMLPLHHKMKAALLGKKSSLTVALDLVRARESGGWLETTSIQESLNLRGDIASRLYSDAIKWADMVNQIA